jgi:F-type H+-transporting ATPase subunit delta
MFHPDRWALAFTAACGEDAEDGLAALKVLFGCLSRLPLPVTGDYSARQLEGMLRRAAGAAGFPHPPQGLEAAIRIILLLVKRGQFRHAGKVVAEAENLLNRKKGILNVVVEAAALPDPDFTADLKVALCKKTAASDVEAEIRIRPELLGGYRLIIGGEAWDASLRGQLQNMAQALKAAPSTGAPGAGGFT